MTWKEQNPWFDEWVFSSMVLRFYTINPEILFHSYLNWDAYFFSSIWLGGMRAILTRSLMRIGPAGLPSIPSHSTWRILKDVQVNEALYIQMSCYCYCAKQTLPPSTFGTLVLNMTSCIFGILDSPCCGFDKFWSTENLIGWQGSGNGAIHHVWHWTWAGQLTSSIQPNREGIHRWLPHVQFGRLHKEISCLCPM